ncbi:hypothetical protein AMJ86_04355 [bacterium SM23_57]|nr:MAG: hypothetical protein AMJ86_04355 [bacterium SM23_57]
MSIMNHKTTTIALIGLIIFFLIIVYAFLYGPLLPFSPIQPGFSKETLSRCDILWSNDSCIPEEYYAIDSLIAETEKFHHLTYAKRITIVLCSTAKQHKRFSMSGGHANTALTGTVIYVNPSIYNALYPPIIQLNKSDIFFTKGRGNIKRDIPSFLKHELSHALLYQNTTFAKARKIKSWLEEGLAVYFGNPHHYYRGDEFKQLAIDRGYFFDLFDNQKDAYFVPPEIKFYFKYGAYGAFMEYLVDSKGMDAVLNFTHEYIKSPHKESQLFQYYFNTTMDSALEGFRKSLENQQ